MPLPIRFELVAGAVWRYKRIPVVSIAARESLERELWLYINQMTKREKQEYWHIKGSIDHAELVYDQYGAYMAKLANGTRKLPATAQE